MSVIICTCTSSPSLGLDSDDLPVGEQRRA